MTAWALAWRTLTAERARTLLAIAGVAVIGALLFDMLLLSNGLLASFREFLDRAGYDVRVTAADTTMLTRGPIRNATRVAADIARLPEVQEVAVVRRERAVVLIEGRSGTRVTLLNVSPGAERRAWKVVEGEGFGKTRASAAPPLVIDRRLARDRSLQPGSMVRLRVTLPDAPSALPAMVFQVVAVAEFDFATPDEPTAATTLDAFERARASELSDEADLILVRSKADAVPAASAIERARPDVRAFSNDQLVAQVNENGFAYFRQISFVLSSITLGFAFLLVATLLTVSVNQRLGQVAALRALGFRRRRIAAALLWESALLVGTGGLLSVPVGWALASQLDRILREMPGIPERVHFFVFEPSTALLHLGLLAATALVAAAYPVWIATRLPIAATLRLETVS
jgi:putative ABC transport system permease protein